MSNIVFTQFEDGLPVDVNKEYYINSYFQRDRLQEIHKLCLFPSKMRLELQDKLKNEKNIINIKTNKYKLTPLMIATMNNNIESVKLLLEYGADINFQNEDGWTALMIACRYCNTSNIECVKLLLEYGADINVKNYFNSTVSTISFIYNEKCIKLLLQYQNDLHHDNIYKIRMTLNTAIIILSNINNHYFNLSLDTIKQLKKLTKFDYNSILLFELKKCVF